MKLSHKYKLRSKRAGVSEFHYAKLIPIDFYNFKVDIYKSMVKPRCKNVKCIVSFNEARN